MEIDSVKDTWVISEIWCWNHKAAWVFSWWNSALTELLEKSFALLNKSHDLTQFIEEFKCEGPNANPELIQGAHSSCLKIDNLLEMLQDRRRQLDKFLRHQRQGLEQVLQICLWHQQETQVTHLKYQGKSHRKPASYIWQCKQKRSLNIFMRPVFLGYFC